MITFAYAGLGYFQYIFFYWIYYYFDQVRHLDANESAGYTTILFVTEGVMMPLGGFVSDRITRAHGAQIGRRVVPMVALTLECRYVLTWAPLASEPAAVVFFLSLAFGFAACCEGPFWAFLTDTAGESVGAASSILNTGSADRRILFADSNALYRCATGLVLGTVRRQPVCNSRSCCSVFRQVTGIRRSEEFAQCTRELRVSDISPVAGSAKRAARPSLRCLFERQAYNESSCAAYLTSYFTTVT